MQLQLLSSVCAGRGVDSCSRSSLFAIVSYLSFAAMLLNTNDHPLLVQGCSEASCALAQLATALDAVKEQLSL